MNDELPRNLKLERIFNKVGFRLNHIKNIYFNKWKEKSSIHHYEFHFQKVIENEKNDYFEDNKQNINILINGLQLILTQYVTMMQSISNIIISSIVDNPIFYDYINSFIERFIKTKIYFIKLGKLFNINDLLGTNLSNTQAHQDNIDKIFIKVQSIYKRKMLDYIKKNDNKFEVVEKSNKNE